MALISKAQAGPGYAQASQTPFAIGPGGGMGFGDLLSRQFQLREQMQQQQLAQMQQDMRFQKLAFQDQRNRAADQRRTKGGVSAGPGQDPSSAYAYDFARSMPGYGGTGPVDAGFLMTRAIGVPAAHQGLMQIGQIEGQLGASALSAGAQIDSNRMRAEAEEKRYGIPQEFGGRSSPTTVQPYAVPQVGNPMWTGGPQGIPMPLPGSPGTPGYIQNRNAEKGGKVPSTGTYKLHKGEVVVPRKASDVMFPYVGGGPKKSKGKAKKSYQLGTGALTRAQKDALLPDDEWKDKLGRKPTVKEWRDRQRTRMELETAIGYVTPTQQVPTESLALANFQPPLVNQAMSPYMSPGQPDFPQTDPSQIAVPGDAPGTPGYTAPPPLEHPGVEAAPLTGGGITYDRPGAGGMTKFGAPGALGPYAGGADLGQVTKQDDLVDMKRQEDEATIADRSAAIAEQRGDKLERYLNEQTNPNRELVAMIKENDRAAQRWRKRSTELRAQADKTKSQMIGQSIATMEAQTERYKIDTEAATARGEATNDKFQGLLERLEVAKSYLKPNEPNEFASRNYQQAFVEAFIPYLDKLDFLGDTREDRAAALSQTALMMANASNEQEVAAAQAQYIMLLRAAEGIGG